MRPPTLFRDMYATPTHTHPSKSKPTSLPCRRVNPLQKTRHVTNASSLVAVLRPGLDEDESAGCVFRQACVIAGARMTDT